MGRRRRPHRRRDRGRESWKAPARKSLIKDKCFFFFSLSLDSLRARVRVVAPWTIFYFFIFDGFSVWCLHMYCTVKSPWISFESVYYHVLFFSLSRIRSFTRRMQGHNRMPRNSKHLALNEYWSHNWSVCGEANGGEGPSLVNVPLHRLPLPRHLRVQELLYPSTRIKYISDIFHIADPLTAPHTADENDYRRKVHACARCGHMRVFGVSASGKRRRLDLP